MIVENLEPSAFSSFFRSSKKLYDLAQIGDFAKDVYLDIEMEEQCETPSLIYNGRTLTIPEIVRMLNAQWINVNVNNLEIFSNPAYFFFGMKEERMDRNLVKLLQFLRIHTIDYVKIWSKVSMFSFMEVCKIDTLEVKSLSSLDFLNYTKNLKARHIDLEFFDEIGYDYPPPNKTFEDFLISSSAITYTITNFFFTYDFVWRLVDAWQTGQKDFYCIKLKLDPEDDSLPLSGLLNSNKIINVGRQLNGLTYAEITTMVYKMTPMILCGEQHSFIFIREDGSVLAVKFNMSEFPDVEMKKIYEEEEEEVDGSEDDDEDVDEDECEEQDEEEDEQEEFE